MFHQKKKSTPIPSKRQEHTMDPQPLSPCTSQSSAFSQQTPSPFVLSVDFKKRPRDISITPSPEPDKRPRLQHKERKPQPSSPCESVSPTSSPLYTPRKIPLTPSQTCKKKRLRGFDETSYSDPKKRQKRKILQTTSGCKKRQRGFDETPSLDPKKRQNISSVPSPNSTFNSTMSLSNRFSVFEDDEDC